jgi:hypothetical protein
MFIVPEGDFQLANRLFLFAHLLACAREHGVRLVNAGFEEYADYFEATSQDLWCGYPPRRSVLSPSPARRARLGRFMKRVALSLEAGKLRRFAGLRFRVLRSGYVSTLTDLEGWIDLRGESFQNTLRHLQVIFFLGPLFRDFGSFGRHADAIREYFRPQLRHRQGVEAVLRRSQGEGAPLVGVHVRQGDFADFESGQYLYSLDQYSALMSRTLPLFGPRARFLVCSNSALRTDMFPDLEVTLGSGHPLEDLYALAGCDYLMGPPSTFSLWASFYGRVPHYTITDVQKVPALAEFRVRFH